ncbi:Fcf2-domain-containing protein [Macrolepiota fuliginosa MF-IS2]|uniref:Fcf2-domain-containing protein n=1 Tax=Macrolepiota fuliginosa MF-IS2 TaxID=1400762 RepID=A0A9P5XQ97_9AGAR|nr:Fcf2-domain-containing protein [Macrolepiota fuliginosa MF-IS2]
MTTIIQASALTTGKGKEKVIELPETSGSESESESSDISALSDPETDTESGSSSDSEEEITEEYLQSLLQRARENAAAAESERPEATVDNEEILMLDDIEQPSLPKLNPGTLPPSYLEVGEARGGAGILVRDPEVEQVEKKTPLNATVSPPLPPPELTIAGKLLTKREKRELKKQTAGPDWFDMPAPSEVDLPRLHREVEALRLRNQLDPKRFYRKDEGEGKGIKGLPKYFAVGQIVATESPFSGSSAENLPKSQRKRTLVDELVDDAEAKRYAKKKFNELQSARGAKGKNTLRAKQALRKPKW